MPATAPVGADIESICSKCGDVWHVVVAKVGERIVKVLCKQCNGQHRYKPPGGLPASPRASSSPATRTRTRTPKPPPPPPAPTVAPDLSRPVRPYRASEVFTPGDRVAHPSFGTGVVESSTSDGRMQVFFASTGRKILAAAKSASQLSPPPTRRNDAE